MHLANLDQRGAENVESHTKEFAHQVIYPDTDSESERLGCESNSDTNGIIAARCAKPRYLVAVTIGGHKITMQLDTGAAVSIIPESTYKTYFRRFILTETKPLNSYSGDKLELLGQICVPVKYDTQTVTLPW